MEELILENPEIKSGRSIRSGRLINTKVKKIIAVLLIIAEIEACVSCAAWIINNSLSRSISDKAEYAYADLTASSVLPAIAAAASCNVYIEANRWKGPVLSKSRGTITGPSGKETYYNLNMSGVVKIMRRMGNTDEYWVRSDGVKMLGEYVMVAANLNLRPRGSLVETSLGTGIVCDTGGFASRNPTQLDIATTW